ncbi:unnamed protein product [Natator depressus]
MHISTPASLPVRVCVCVCPHLSRNTKCTLSAQSSPCSIPERGGKRWGGKRRTDVSAAMQMGMVTAFAKCLFQAVGNAVGIIMLHRRTAPISSCSKHNLIR